jgi:hypothetical protein
MFYLHVRHGLINTLIFPFFFFCACAVLPVAVLALSAACMHALPTSLMLGHYLSALHAQVTSCLLSLNGDDPAFSVARVAQVRWFRSLQHSVLPLYCHAWERCWQPTVADWHIPQRQAACAAE